MGATGLMQLRPDTAREVATRLGLEWTSEDALFDPRTNILLGTAYLRELLDRFDHMDVALAAFHAGPNRVASDRLHLGPVAVQYTDRVWDAIVDYHKAVRIQSRIS
jgi:soluble lytic murein transglycosylase